MYIAIHCAGMPFDGNTIPSGQSLGGSESAAYYMAKELVKLGHDVYVFTGSQQSGRWDGVVYEWFGNVTEQNLLGERFHFAMSIPFDVCVIQRHPGAFIVLPNSKLNMWWLHDLGLYRQTAYAQRHLLNIDRVLTVSDWHKNQINQVYGISKDSIINTINGVDYEMFEGLEGNEREPRSLVYMARPERGLELLVGGDDCIMNQLKDCHLYVCAYNNTIPQMQSYYEHLWSRCDALPNVTNVGSLGKRELYQLLSKCMIYAYPTTFEDTSCIASLEANAAGLPVVGYKWSAVPETLTGGGAVLLPMKEKNGNPYVDKKQYADAVRSLLGNEKQWNDLHEKALTKKQTWEMAAIQWDAEFKKLLAEKSADKNRLHRHLVYNSDIVAAVKDGALETLPEIKDDYYFYFDGDYKGHYDRYYKREKEKGVVYGPEDLIGTSRFEAIAGAVHSFAPERVLDYGCAHGHYIVNLVKKMPNVEFVGVDINALNIEAAEKWAKDENCKATFFVGDQKTLSDEEMFDVIIVAELLEHVPDPQEIIESLSKHLNPQGSFVVSTPYGPWEALGHKENPGWRAHIHYFERRDLQEMFGTQQNYRLMGVPYQEEYGSFIVTFQRSDQPVGQIDYKRKLQEQAPRETLSVCMIAKDSEYTIGKTLQSVMDYADEIIIGIDDTTTDDTKTVCEKFGARTFPIESPIISGFDEARNKTIKDAVMDWIFWIDSDETLENAHNLLKYLRQNPLAGYGVPQHHVAIEPAGVMKTDYPVRLFRNHRGVKFYGVVHEHPEKVMNESVGQIIIAHDLGIMHVGYSTEDIRRERFNRNWPLMKRDRQKFPERRLSKFLWVRDLSHFIRWRMAQTHGTIVPDIMKAADEGISTWRELLKLGETRLIVEGLEFYEVCAQIVTQGNGIRFGVNLDATKGNGGINMQTKHMEAMFASQDDIDALVKHLVYSKTHIFNERYF